MNPNDSTEPHETRNSERPEVVMVTGASAGVGRATAVAFAREGATVGLVARGAAGLDAAARDVVAAGGRAVTLTADVADYGQLERAADILAESGGGIDIWVNNAMTTVFSPVVDVDPADFRRATEVTYLGQVHGTMIALGHMRPRNRGAIVNVGSALAFVAIPLQAAYCGAKFACRGFTQAVREELLHEGSAVTIGMVHLPGLDTPQFDWCRSKLSAHPQPVPPVYAPDVAAEAIVATAHSGRRNRIVGSWNRLLVAGASTLPGVVEHYAARTAVSGQLAEDMDESGQRSGNLYEPLDADVDHGASGSFGGLTGGVRNPSFVEGLPSTLGQLARAAGARCKESVSRLVGS